MLKKDGEKIFELLYNLGSKSELSPIFIIFIEPIFDLIFRIFILKYSFGKKRVLFYKSWWIHIFWIVDFLFWLSDFTWTNFLGWKKKGQ